MIRTQDGQLYTGITTDIQRRWQEHSSGKGGARYFRTSKPAQLCRVEEHPDRSSASKREAEIKKMPKSMKENLVAHYQAVGDDSLRVTTALRAATAATE